MGELPKLVYYRHQIPIIYESRYNLCDVRRPRTRVIHDLPCVSDELTKEEDVLEWLVQNKSTGDEDDVIEDVTAKSLNTLIDSVDNLVVLFCK